MAVTDYVSLDQDGSSKWLCYRATVKSWTPGVVKPATVRLNLDGTLDGTYGAGILYEWTGELVAPWNASGSPAAGTKWGSAADFCTTLKKRQELLFWSHEGVEYRVHIAEWRERSLMPNIDATDNKVYFLVKIQGVLYA